jgi:hypothetical protein
VKKLKDYVYISDTKVDILFGQIAEPMLKNITATLGLDLKFIKLSVSGDVGRRHEHRVQRLETVLDYMEKSSGFGTVDQPDSYVKEPNLNMKWGEIEGDVASALFFAGITDRTVVALGGSPKHLIGQNGSATTTVSHSHMLLKCLRGIIGDNEKRAASRTHSSDDDSLYVIEDVVRDMKGPRESMEFVAKRLLFGRTQRRSADKVIDKRVLLATPLYVARQ